METLAENVVVPMGEWWWWLSNKKLLLSLLVVVVVVDKQQEESEGRRWRRLSTEYKGNDEATQGQLV